MTTAANSTATQAPKKPTHMNAEDFPFPVVFGIPEEPESLITLCVCSDGIYTMKKIMGDGYVLTKAKDIPGISAGKEMICALPRLIPLSIFFTTARFFRYVETHFKKDGLEAYVLVAYREADDSFFLYVPEQEIASASVRYDISKFHQEHPGCYIVLDIHSHTSKMGAFFSGTDDNDDNRDRYSMVLGKINKAIPDYKIRFSSQGRRVEFNLEDLFEDTEEAADLDFVAEMAKIKLQTYSATTTYGSSRNYSNQYGGDYGAEVDVDWDAYEFGTNYGHGHGNVAKGNEVVVYGADNKPLSTSGRQGTLGFQASESSAGSKKQNGTGGGNAGRQQSQSGTTAHSANITEVTELPTWFSYFRDKIKGAKPSIKDLMRKELEHA